jgi:putative transposase
LNANQFLSIEDAKRKIEAWRVDYNVHRPHSGLGNVSPAEWMKRVRNEDEEARIVSV